MLRNFLYLNEKTLNGYLSALEDGLRAAGEHQSSRRKTSGSSDGEPESSNGLSTDVQQTQSFTDTSEARFERFANLSAQNPERSGWTAVEDDGSAFGGIRPGALIQFECEIFVPPLVRSLSPSGGVVQAIEMMRGIMPLMNDHNGDTKSLPSQDQVAAMSAVSSMVGDDLLVVGERDETDWRVSGRLISASIRDDELDGLATVVGKVSSVLKEGEHKSLLALPGTNFMTREQRRAQAKIGPEPGQEQNWLSGPAVTLDILAIYR